MKKFILCALAFALTACQQAPTSYTPEPFAFESSAVAPWRINVAEIRIVEGYQSSLRKPNVEQDFPVPPAHAVKKWVASRLKATGTRGVMEITIRDASVTETALPKTEGITGFFTDDQDARYDARLVVTMRIFSGVQGISDATGDVEVTRSRSINEKATVFERSQLYHQMTRDMMLSFDSEAEKRLRQYFSAFLN
jgi:hypothetical protein